MKMTYVCLLIFLFLFIRDKKKILDYINKLVNLYTEKMKDRKLVGSITILIQVFFVLIK
jgi:hypothetical protein